MKKACWLHPVLSLIHIFNLSLPFSPVQQRDAETDFHHLVIFQRIVSATEITVFPCISHGSKQVDIAAFSFGRRYCIIGFELFA